MRPFLELQNDRAEPRKAGFDAAKNDSRKEAEQPVKTVKRILDVVVTACFAIVLIAVVALVAPRLVGVSAFAVLSGSMEPLYPTGSVVYVNTNVNTQNFLSGEVITFMVDQDTVVTHRIVGTEAGEDGVTRYQTKGDANDQPDSKLVHPGNVIGTPVLCVPFVGYVVGWVQQPPGTYLAVCAAAIVVFLMFLPDLFPSKKREEDEEGGEGEKVQEIPVTEDWRIGKQEVPASVAAGYECECVGPVDEFAARFDKPSMDLSCEANRVWERPAWSSEIDDEKVEPVGKHVLSHGRHAGTDKTQRAGRHARVNERAGS